MAAKALTKKIITDLEKYITQTTSLKIACGCAGVPSSTFYAWQKAAKEIEEEGKGESDLTKDELLLLEFLERIDLAKAKSCKPAIDAVTDYGITSNPEELTALASARTMGDLSREDYFQEMKRRGILRNEFSLADNEDRIATEMV